MLPVSDDPPHRLEALEAVKRCVTLLKSKHSNWFQVIIEVGLNHNYSPNFTKIIIDPKDSCLPELGQTHQDIKN
jgi:hypothetical protein